MKVNRIAKDNPPHTSGVSRTTLLAGLVLGMFLMVLSACNSEDARQRRELLGRWTVYMAELNNIPNGLMENGWFDFADNGSVTSNIFPDSLAHSYNLEEGVLRIQTETPVELTIARIENDSLCLEGQIGHHFMRYYLSRQK